MRQLIKFELKKIVGNRTALIVLLGAFLLNLLFFFLSVAGQIHFSAQIRTLSGITAIRYEQQITKKHKGFLTDEYINKNKLEISKIENNPKNQKIDQDATKIKQAEMRKDGYTEAEIAKMPPVMKLKDEVYLNQMDQYDFAGSVIGLQERLPAIIAELRLGNINGIYENRSGYHNPNAPKPAGTTAEISKLLSMYEKVDKPYYYDYYNGWLEFCTGFSRFAAIILGAVIIILLSPVFSQEYSSNMDNLVLTAKYGKNKLITAKVLSAFALTTALYLSFAALNSVLYAAVYGLRGYNCNIQIHGDYFESPYGITFLQFYIVILCLGLIGMLFMTAIALFVSSKSKNSFISVVTLAAILYIPAIDMSQTSLLADKILKLFPFNIISPSGSFEIGVLYDVFGKMLTQPVMMIIAAVLVSALLVPLSCRIFRNHQVIN